jgi:DNA polymerase-1
MFLDGDDLNEKKGVNPENGLLCKLDDNDRVHGRFLSFGTISGRPSCSKPNLLNIPKSSDIRSLFIAPEGWKLIDIDYSQAELVLLAYLSQDKQFMKDVGEIDFHTATAKSIMKMEEINSEIRRKAKGVNFLNAYGGGAKKLSKNLKITEAEAWQWLKGWNETYPEVGRFKRVQKDAWREKHYIEGIYGRKKRFPPALNTEIESYYDRIAVNFMCQNGVGDAINTALIDIDYLFGKLFGWTPESIYRVPGIVLSVYDSIIVESPDGIANEISNVMQEIMSAELPKLNVSLKMDVDIVQRWGAKLTDDENIEFEDSALIYKGME